MIKADNGSHAKLLVLFVACCVCFIVAAGVFSDLYLGDETFHYRLASYIYKADLSRPLFDPLALTNPQGKSYYVDPMLWHYGLAMLWKAAGRVSQSVAQVYQAVWYVILVIGTYLLGGALRDRKTAFWASVLVASLPMSASLSIILHTDIPVAALSTLAIYLAVKKRFLCSGFVYALATYMKRNSYLLFPSLLLVILIVLAHQLRDPIGRRLFKKNLLLFILPVCILVLPEIFYRYATFGVQSFWSGNIRRPDKTFRSLQHNLLPGRDYYVNVALRPKDIPLQEEAPAAGSPFLRVTDIRVAFSDRVAYSAVDIDRAAPLLVKDEIHSQVTGDFSYKGKQPFVFYDESNLLMSPLVFIKYFGVAICFAWFLYFLRKSFKKQDIFLFLPIAIYLPIYGYLFRLGLNVRYLSPLIGLASVIGGIGCATLSRRSLRFIIGGLCVAQFLSASATTFYCRNIPAGIKRAYGVIKNELAENERVMCARNALSLHTGKYSIWLGVPALHELGFLFFNADDRGMAGIFRKYDIRYILVEKDKIYDDSLSRHTGGYPMSFVDKLRKSSLFEALLENEHAIFFRIYRE